ncbi:MAG: DNA-processing protein DprA [Synergistaceae bacterium]|nr:DNA-processing protein DprA [Synergistaceae bacterium]
MKTNEFTRAGILLNAIKAPYEIFEKLCENFEPDELFQGENFWQELGLNKNQQEKLANLISKNWHEKEILNLEKIDARFITSKDLDYPAKLKDLSKPPIGLYVRGNANISLPSIAIVGTRKCSDYARTVATNLAQSLAAQNITIISGGARGIDTAGHRGALEANGVTISVFGTGIDRVYPAENRDLFSRILERGALISEYPLGTGGESWRFPERNRIIVAMASRVVVVESPEGGGAMLTARMALKLKREVWSVPGRISDDVCRGTNELFNEGAKATISINDFVKEITGKNEQFNLNFNEYLESKPEQNTPILSDEEKIIYSILRRQGGRLTDEILNESKLDLMTVQMALMNLEANGLIMNSSGRYSAII